MNDDIKALIKEPHKLGVYLGFDKLTDIHTDWIKKYWLSKDDYVLQAHRNSYKTTSVIVVGYLWFSLINPNIPVLLVREESKNAERTVQTISKLLKTEKMRYLYHECYGIKDFELVKDNADSIILPTKEKVTIEGSLDCIGIGGSLTGRHYPKIVGDDIITIKDRISRADRDRKKLFIQELESIKTTDGHLSVSGTPWHKEDGFSLLPEPDKYPVGSIEIEGFTPKKLDSIRERTSASLYAANYLLKHISDENREFADPKYDYWDKVFPSKALVDPAYYGKDTTALSIAYRMGDIIMVTGWVWDESITDLFDKITTILKEYSCSVLHVEENADKRASLKEFQNRFPCVTGFHEKENKHIKIVTNIKKNWPEIRFDRDCQAEYLTQIVDYELGQEPDDAPDSLASLMRVMEQNNVRLNGPIVEEIFEEFKY